MTTIEDMWEVVERTSDWEDQNFAVAGLADLLEESDDPLTPVIRWMLKHEQFPLVTDWWNKDRYFGKLKISLDFSDLPSHIFIHLRHTENMQTIANTISRITYKSYKEAVEALDEALRKAGEL